MDNLRGSALMVASMLGFALEDTFIKQLAETLPMGQVLALLGCGGVVLFGGLARLNGRPVLSRALLSRAVLMRNAGEMVGSAGFVTALALTPLSSAAAILQATPLAATLGAALFLGEVVGWRRWTAIGVGFAGVLLVIRPGFAGFEPASLFAVAAVAGLALRDLATRMVPAAVGSTQLSCWAFAALVPTGLLMLAVPGFDAVATTPADLARLAAAFVCGGFAYYAIVAAVRLGEVSVIMPFRYSRLVFAMAIGVTVFGERPDGLMLLGAALIVGAGLYTIWRETRGRPATVAQGAG